MGSTAIIQGKSEGKRQGKRWGWSLATARRYSLLISANPEEFLSLCETLLFECSRLNCTSATHLRILLVLPTVSTTVYQHCKTATFSARILRITHSPKRSVKRYLHSLNCIDITNWKNCSTPRSPIEDTKFSIVYKLRSICVHCTATMWEIGKIKVFLIQQSRIRNFQ